MLLGLHVFFFNENLLRYLSLSTSEHILCQVLNSSRYASLGALHTDIRASMTNGKFTTEYRCLLWTFEIRVGHTSHPRHDMHITPTTRYAHTPVCELQVIHPPFQNFINCSGIFHYVCKYCRSLEAGHNAAQHYSF